MSFLRFIISSFSGRFRRPCKNSRRYSEGFGGQFDIFKSYAAMTDRTSSSGLNAETLDRLPLCDTCTSTTIIAELIKKLYSGSGAASSSLAGLRASKASWTSPPTLLLGVGKAMMACNTNAVDRAETGVFIHDIVLTRLADTGGVQQESGQEARQNLQEFYVDEQIMPRLGSPRMLWMFYGKTPFSPKIIIYVVKPLTNRMMPHHINVHPLSHETCGL